MIRRRIQTVANGDHSDGSLPPEGKDAAGRFAKGNHFGRGGNAYSREQARIQAAIKSKMSDEELEEFVKAWIAKAKAGKGIFLISLLERWAGRVGDWAVEERIAELEAQIIDLTEQPQSGRLAST